MRLSKETEKTVLKYPRAMFNQMEVKDKNCHAIGQKSE